MELRNLKGTCDFLPQEQRIRQEIIRSLQDIFERYGYQPLETPTVCYFDVLASKYAGGAEILKEVYKLSDQGERELGLRYDLTVPFARMVGMNPEIRMPFKRYEIGKVFRDGPIKAGRNREFIQCDVDVLGVKSIMAEAERIIMALEVYNKLGLDVYISYNNRKLLSGIIELAEIKQELSSEVILIIDKLEKAGEEAVKSELSFIGIEQVKIDALFGYMKTQPDKLMLSLISYNQYNELIKEGLDELNRLNLYFDTLDIKESLKFTPSLARGLEIYTGTVWEVFLTDGSITSSVGAGGRYDNIIGTFLDNGADYPAVGMTFGLDVIFQAIRLKGVVNIKPPVDLYIIPLGTAQACMKIAQELRQQGLCVEIDISEKKLKKSLSYANKCRIPYVMVIGENEISTGVFKIKDMELGKEIEACLEQNKSYIAIMDLFKSYINLYAVKGH
ncbi:MAG: histidine--tRNA ligase [Firmicutes bacterium]|nr:histidine--tRNA ligase [Bacillota bacterium]